MKKTIEADFGTIEIKSCMIDGEFNMLDEGVDVWISGKYMGNLIGVTIDDEEDNIIELVDLNFN